MGISQSLDAPTRCTNSFFRLETWLFANSLLDSLSEDSRGELVEGLGLKRGVVDTMSKPIRKRDRFLAGAYSRSQKIRE